MLGMMQQLGVVPDAAGPARARRPRHRHISGAPLDARSESTALMERFIEEVWNKGNLAVADEIFHPEAHEPQRPDAPARRRGRQVHRQHDPRRVPGLLDGDHPHRRRGRPRRRSVPPGRDPRGDLMGIAADRQEGRVDRDRDPADRRRQGRRELVRRRHARSHGPARRRRPELGADRWPPQDVIDRYYETANAGDWDAWCDLFTDDMVMDEQLAGHIEALATLRADDGRDGPRLLEVPERPEAHRRQRRRGRGRLAHLGRQRGRRADRGRTS